MLEGAHLTWMARAGAWPRRAFIAAIAQVKTRYGQLKKRYGPRYTAAMVGTAFFTFFLPIPAISLLAVGLVVLTAEIHRAVSKRAAGDTQARERMRTNAVEQRPNNAARLDMAAASSTILMRLESGDTI